MSSPTYDGEVLEAATPGTVVLTVSAMDLDQVLRVDNQQILDSYWGNRVLLRDGEEYDIGFGLSVGLFV